MSDSELKELQNAQIAKLMAETQQINMQVRFYPLVILVSPFALAILGWILKGTPT